MPFVEKAVAATATYSVAPQAIVRAMPELRWHVVEMAAVEMAAVEMAVVEMAVVRCFGCLS